MRISICANGTVRPGPAGPRVRTWACRVPCAPASVSGLGHRDLCYPWTFPIRRVGRDLLRFVKLLRVCACKGPLSRLVFCTCALRSEWELYACVLYARSDMCSSISSSSGAQKCGAKMQGSNAGQAMRGRPRASCGGKQAIAAKYRMYTYQYVPPLLSQ